MTIESTKQEKGASTALYAVIAIFTVGLMLLMFAAGLNGATQKPTEHPATTVSAEPVAIQAGFEMPVKIYGLVESPQAANVSFDTGGQVTDILVDEGDAVHAGDVLAKLDSDRLAARLEELNATLERTRADLTLAELSEKRVAVLVEKKLESSQRLDEVKASTAAASAQVKEIEASINSVAVEQAKTDLIAPFSGTISARYFDQGSVVAAGSAVLSLTSDAPFQARFAVPADMVSLFSVGDTVTLKVDGASIESKVNQLSPVRNQQTRTIDILVNLSSNKGVRPGDLATLLGQRHSESVGSWIPASALSNGLRGLWRVFVVNNEGALTLESRTVEVIYTDGKRAFVRGALSDGDQLVIGGTHKLAPGQAVKLSSAQSGAVNANTGNSNKASLNALEGSAQ
ncbi:efflux RND transporter periplasmic adaptor subunit [Alteromonas sp. 1_MG-2023]|uniref:efflux RND transporter periplasmic adaptor subunit n=1 Tax=Alteromonas sp. 1_MG-2023 TaxID=3062669 RepID=UPI0026E1D0A4|nr:efflux RND transporter periplasmic adaptor subunit [Alteromonas sp. 1_MG-2023]MDO6567813.1 efflux RND transporter periplasmic adaptor subunit [Alteromonas sp. 1_MG-2023]